MSKKHRASKGRTSRVAKTQWKELSAMEQARITSLMEDAGWSETHIVKELSVKRSTVGAVA